MSEVWAVDTVQQAVELAQSMRREGRYSWFRGQIREWPPHSGLFRAQQNEDPSIAEHARERFSLFCRWLHGTPELNHLLTEDPPHRLFAIAQHYGIPTHYIDFTTDPAVAGFFAADAPAPPDEGRSCIYCLNHADLMRVYGHLQAAEVRPPGLIEPVEIDVSNLWRLQAQRGVFLYAPYNWEIDYPLDKIVFPYSGYPSYPSRNQIYPSEKSALEHLIDQYDDIERKHFGRQYMEQMFREMRERGQPAAFIDTVSHPDGIFADVFQRPEQLKAFPSWVAAENPNWKRYPDEGYDAVAGRIERIRIIDRDPVAIGRAIAYGVSHALGRNPNLRAWLVEWALEGASDIQADAIQAALRSAWNGMRQRPFTDAHVAAAMSGAAELIAGGLGQATTSVDRNRLFAAMRGEGMQVEFAYANRASSQAMVTVAALRSSMRADFGELVKPEHRETAGSLSFALQVLANPSILFEFEGFVDLFAAEIIPSQIALGRNPILYDPAATTRFGLP